MNLTYCQKAFQTCCDNGLSKGIKATGIAMPQPPTVHSLKVLDQTLCLLPEKALYLPTHHSLLVADIHLGKAETFQAAGIPITQQVNTETLQRLQYLCETWQPQQLFILGDLFHARQALVPEVIAQWTHFLAEIPAQVTLIVGNHDRPLTQRLAHLPMTCQTDALSLGSLWLSHEPIAPNSLALNICGHVHPVIRLRSQLDTLRLPCFYLETQPHRLTLPSFGTFTGGFEISPKPGTTAYIVTPDGIIPLKGK